MLFWLDDEHLDDEHLEGEEDGGVGEGDGEWETGEGRGAISSCSISFSSLISQGGSTLYLKNETTGKSVYIKVYIS